MHVYHVAVCNILLIFAKTNCKFYRLVWFMVFNTTFNNFSVILWWSVLLVEETGVPGENHQPVASHWQTLSHNVVSVYLAWAEFELTTLVVIGSVCISNCKSNYHTITTTTPTSPLPQKKIYAMDKYQNNLKIKLVYICTTEWLH
jgi:hypothetical protein